jgi:hypothetical protein
MTCLSRQAEHYSDQTGCDAGRAAGEECPLLAPEHLFVKGDGYEARYRCLVHGA